MATNVRRSQMRPQSVGAPKIISSQRTHKARSRRAALAIVLLTLLLFLVGAGLILTAYISSLPLSGGEETAVQVEISPVPEALEDTETTYGPSILFQALEGQFSQPQP